MKLLAFDLDGTLLDSRSRLTEENRLAVQRARQAGLDVILVTGRSWRSAKPYYDQLELTGTAICYMGALAVDGTTGTVLHHRPLVAEAWERLKAFALAEQLAVTACVAVEQAVADGELPAGGLVAADMAYSTCPADDFQGWEDWNPYTQMAPDLAPCQAAPIMLAVYGDRAVQRVLEAFPQELPESQFDLHDKVKGETVLHVWHSAVDKGQALAAYCRSRGIAAAEVAAFGDMPMDASMLRYAGIGVCVPDGHPDLKPVATWVMEPAAAIDRILRGE